MTRIVRSVFHKLSTETPLLLCNSCVCKVIKVPLGRDTAQVGIAKQRVGLRSNKHLTISTHHTGPLLLAAPKGLQCLFTHTHAPLSPNTGTTKGEGGGLCFTPQ